MSPSIMIEMAEAVGLKVVKMAEESPVVVNDLTELRYFEHPEGMGQRAWYIFEKVKAINVFESPQFKALFQRALRVDEQRNTILAKYGLRFDLTYPFLPIRKAE